MSTRSGLGLQRFLARTGQYSRRAAQAIVLSGRVTLNSQLTRSPTTRVQDGDSVQVEGRFARTTPVSTSVQAEAIAVLAPCGKHPSFPQCSWWINHLFPLMWQPPICPRLRESSQTTLPYLHVTLIFVLVQVDGGTPLTLPTAESSRLWRYHKPTGLITTHYDPEASFTLFFTLFGHS